MSTPTVYNFAAVNAVMRRGDAALFAAERQCIAFRDQIDAIGDDEELIEPFDAVQLAAGHPRGCGIQVAAPR